ncbi:MAG TPA: Ig-like domain-containing protein, partial [Terriglobales bacterium]|nr:Ig-like domain-containing protein [Terriglobales bacterium]
TTSSFSLTHGDVAQITGATVLDQNNQALATQPTFTYSSADPNSVTVTTTGLVCAGVFDANNVVCKTTDSSGNPLPDKTVNITVAALGLNTTVPIYVHSHVDNITVQGPQNAPVCVSQNLTEQFSAKAFHAGQDITSLVGPFTWTSSNSQVATVDSNGVVTSRQPGATTIVASVANTTGTPGVFVACPPKTISLHVSGATDTSFSVASGTSQTLAADVTDVLGQPISGAGLTFVSFDPSIASITTPGGVISTPGAGVSTFVAACTPPGCNPASGPFVNFNGTGAGLAIYSNPVKGTITGTTASTVYVTGNDNGNTSLIPIDTGTNAAGTAITLSASPNSMIFDRAGTFAYLGSSSGVLVFSTSSNSVTQSLPSVTGSVLSVSNDGNRLVVSDTSAGKVFVVSNPSASSATVKSFDLAGVTAADFNPDNSKAYFTNGSTVYEYSPNAGLKTLSLGADGVVFTPQAAVAYFGGSSILGLAVCNDSAVQGAGASANILAVAADGTHMIGAGAGGWADLSYTVSNSAGCPSSSSNTLRTSGFGAAFVGTPTQIAVASDDSRAFLTGYTGGSDATGVPFYDLADGTTGVISLSAGGPLFSGGLTKDAHSLYVGVGGGSPAVHRIDLTASGGPTDANQISVSFTPRIVVVRPK